MTPHSLSDQSFQGLLSITAHAAHQRAALDHETRAAAGEAMVKMIVDFVAYASAVGQGRVAEFLAEDPSLVTLGEALLDGKGYGVIMLFDSLRLWFTFEDCGIVLQDVRRICSA